MKWTLSNIPESNIIHIETTGKMTVDLLNQMVGAAMEAGKLLNSGLFLVDHRNMLLDEMSFIETVDRPKELDRLGFPRNSRIAQVFPEANIETFQFLETVLINRGYQMRIFKDISSAKEWLNS